MDSPKPKWPAPIVSSILGVVALLPPLAMTQDVFDPLGESSLDQLPRQISIQVEWIEVPHTTFTRLTTNAKRSADAGRLREELLSLIEKGEGQMVESMQLVTRSGQRASAESIREVIYPTEWNPPLPAEPKKEANENPEGAEQAAEEEEDSPSLGLPLPVAFETRSVGATFEVDPVIGSDGRTIDLNMAPEIVSQVGESEYGAWRNKAGGEVVISAPIFYTMKATTAIVCQDGHWVHAATTSPHDDVGASDPSRKVLILVRADIIFVGAPPDEDGEGATRKQID